MAINIVQERKKQRYLVLALAFIIFVMLLIVWLGFLRKKEAVVLPSVPVLIYIIPDVEIDWQFLEGLRSQTFQPFEEINSFGGSFGRKNPFIIY